MSVSLSDWAAIANLMVAFVALAVAVVAVYVALRTMKDTEEDWKQRKWYDLYFAANEAFILLDRYKRVYPNPRVRTQESMSDWNDLMMYVRRCHATSTVFPKTSAIDDLHEATNFSNPEFAYDKERFEKLGDAVEALRQKALINPSVLEQQTSMKLVMHMNAKRGFNRLVIVLSVAWAIYVLFVYPILQGRHATELYRVELHSCSQEQLAKGQSSDGCVQYAELKSGADMWSLKAYYARESWFLLIVVLAMPVLSYGLLAVGFWVWRGFRTT